MPPRSPDPRRARLSRRAFARASLGAVALFGRAARGAPSLAVGGRLSLSLPWPATSLDPHALDDVVAALLGDAVFETLYTRVGGAPAPLLAATMPEASAGSLRVPLRAGVVFAGGRAVTARDVVFSLDRARAAGARGWLAPFGRPRVDGAHALRFPARDGVALAAALASPLTAIVPASFRADRPEGTGPFAVAASAAGLVLTRNERAIAPAYADEIALRPATDLAASLRSFEAGKDDLGWLGAGLHDPRPGASPFDGGLLAYALLRVGREAGPWGAPGLAQRLADGLPPERFAYLGLAPWTREPEQGWGGPPGEVLVRGDAPWLVELARAVAATLARPGHELAVRLVPEAELARRKRERSYLLAVDVARPLDGTPLGAVVALATADDPAAAEDVARHPPRLGAGPLRSFTRTRRVGVLGEVRAQGARAGHAWLPVGSQGIDWGGSFRGRT